MRAYARVELGDPEAGHVVTALVEIALELFPAQRRSNRLAVAFQRTFHRVAMPLLLRCCAATVCSVGGRSMTVEYRVWQVKSPLGGLPSAKQLEKELNEAGRCACATGKIVKQFVGDNNFSMPYQELGAWHMDFPRETPDPNPVIAEASAGARRA